MRWWEKEIIDLAGAREAAAAVAEEEGGEEGREGRERLLDWDNGRESTT